MKCAPIPRMNFLPMRLLLSWSAIAGLVLILACKEEQEVSAPLPPPEIPVIKVIQEDVPIYAEYVGQTYGAVDIAIRARVEGFLESIHFDEGSRVNKGQLLYVVDPSPYEARVAEAASRVAEAKTVLVKAESDLARIRPLAAENAVSQADLDAAEAQYGAAQASVEAAEASKRLAEIQLSYSEIKSPVTGLIGKTEARVGDFVGREPNPVLLNTVSDIEDILVRFSIPEAEYLRLRQYYQENRAEIQESGEYGGIQLILADGSVHPYKGVMDFAEREVDPGTGTLLIQASFANPEEIIRPGQYAKVRFLENLSKDGLLIPQRCVMEMQGQFSVFVVGDSNTVRRQRVVPGEHIGNMVLVRDGLMPEDRVVIDALQKVGANMVVNPIEASFERLSADF